MTHINEIADKK